MRIPLPWTCTSKKGLRFNGYTQFRRRYNVPAYTGAKVLYMGRPATIIASSEENHLILRLEDRQDKTEIRAVPGQITFLEPMPERKPTKKQALLEAEQNKPDDAFEEGWW